MSETPDVAYQVRFGSDGEMEVDEHTETDLQDWGVVDPGPERETRIEQEAAEGEKPEEQTPSESGGG